MKNLMIIIMFQVQYINHIFKKILVAFLIISHKRNLMLSACLRYAPIRKIVAADTKAEEI